MARPESVPDDDSPYEREWHDTGAAPLLTELYGDLTQVVLPADRTAPSAARALLSFCVGRLVDARVLIDAQLLMSELVSNAVLHGSHTGGDSIGVRIRLDAENLRFEVHDRGIAGTVAANGTDELRDNGFGLDLVGLLSTTWGVRRQADTCVWVEMARA